MRTTHAVLLTLMLVACSCDSGSSADAAPETGCELEGATCARLSVRWDVSLDNAPSTCAAIAGERVMITMTNQATGTSTSSQADCAAGVVLTTDLPLGPYLVTGVLSGASGTLDTQTMTATLSVMGTVAETHLGFSLLNSGVYQACGTGMPCANPNLTCVPAEHGWCTKPCSNTAECVAFDEVRGPGAVTLCGFTPFGEQVDYCELQCNDTASCPGGMQCAPADDIGSSAGSSFICQP
jgi:hypothetical protein